MHFTRLLIPARVAGAYLVSIGLLTIGTASAQTYPTKPVRIIVPFAPGGSTDIIARAMAQKLGEGWGQAAVVENRAGGNTLVGTDLVAKSTPDGYTLLNASAPFANNVALFGGKLPYDTMADFAPITLVNTTPLVLTVNPNLPAKTLKEMIALAKSKPGQMNFGSSATGGVNHLSGELLNFMADIKIMHIPYKGNAPALTDLMGGRVDYVFNGTTSSLSMIQAGKLRALVVSSRTRTSVLPDVPTIDESGIKGFEALGWNGMFAPAKTPRAIVNKIHADAIKALNSAEVQQRLKNDGSDAVGNTPEQFTAWLKEEIIKWGKVVKFADIKPE